MPASLTKATSEISSFKMNDDSGDKRINWNMRACTQHDVSDKLQLMAAKREKRTNILRDEPSG